MSMAATAESGKYALATICSNLSHLTLAHHRHFGNR